MRLSPWLSTVFLAILWIGFTLPASLSPAAAADLAQNLQPSVTYTFGESMNVQLELPPDSGVKNVQLFFRERDSTNTQSAQMLLENNTATVSIDLKAVILPAFHEVEYWFGLEGIDGKEQVTPVYAIFYEDNRFEWQTLIDEPFQVHWYNGDLASGQMVLDIARAGMQSARQLLNFPEPELVNIYVYATGQDLRSSLQLASVSMVAGHADPSLGVMFVSLPSGPSQRMETGRQVPHELMHIFLFQKFGPNYTRIPTWLNEGLASNNEELPNPDYFVVLEDATRKNSLLPFANLCSGFPMDAASFYQSYAQADSFVSYLYQTYGTTKMETLVELYSDGVACNKAPEDVLGDDLLTLEKIGKLKRWALNLQTHLRRCCRCFPGLLYSCSCSAVRSF